MTGFKGWRVTRSGSIAVIVLLVLAGVLFYAIVTVQQRGETARREEALQIALQNLEEESAAPGVIAVAPPEQPSTNGQETPAPTAPAPTSLPETGPTAWMIAPLALLTYSIALFATSTRTAPNTRLSSVFRVK